MDFKWVSQSSFDPELIDNFALQLNVPKIFASILISRGVDSLDKAKHFFRATVADLNDPFLLPDMQKAVDRIIKARDKQEKVLIYGDYDVDGITSVSMLYLFFGSLGCNISFYIPNRLNEGYGISQAGIEEAAKKNITLIVSVDCGITAMKEVELANSLGIDVIVSDHHEPAATLPNAYAILNPKCEHSNYPFQELAGVGVAFKLLQAIATTLKLDSTTIPQYMDLVAIGSAADIVPLVDENRILMREGLLSLNNGNREGLKALIDTAGIHNSELNTGQIVFILAPRLNAVGRMGNAERAVNLLTTTNQQTAKNIAHILESENRIRKNIDDSMFLEAQELVTTYYDLEKNSALVLDMEGWHQGVIGIVASRIVEKYYRPTIMISCEDGMGKGSARSINGFDIYEALKQCEDLLVSFGGHKYAAGLSIQQKDIMAFRERFNNIAHQHLDEDLLARKIKIDGEIQLNDINERFIRLLKMLAPFGPQNMRPVFLTRGLQVIGKPTIVGNNHLKFKVRQNNVIIDVIGFNLGDKIYRISPGEQNLDLVYIIEENEYLGKINLQLKIKDLR
jgi:single-stranded-DNA-specific exonuclease